jgi:hypothetical protein
LEKKVWAWRYISGGGQYDGGGGFVAIWVVEQRQWMGSATGARN